MGILLYWLYGKTKRGGVGMSVLKRKRLPRAISAVSRRVPGPVSKLNTLSDRSVLLAKGLIEQHRDDALVFKTSARRAGIIPARTAAKGSLRSGQARSGWFAEFENLGRSIEGFRSISKAAMISQWTWSGGEKRQKAIACCNAGPSARTSLTVDGNIRLGRIGK